MTGLLYSSTEIGGMMIVSTHPCRLMVSVLEMDDPEIVLRWRIKCDDDDAWQ
jgi:hypothetical protein